ncbi:MAG: DUF3794 domain-containing protein [Eubacteriales bacterium]
MELRKKNIHMEDTKCTASTQITLDEDIIVSDHNPDVSKIIYEKGFIKVDEIKPSLDQVQVKGRVTFELLYLASDENRQLFKMSGEISFEESIYVEGVQTGDFVQLHRELEGLTIGMINPRKLSVQSLISFAVSLDDVRDVESGVEILVDEEIVCKNQKVEVAEIVLQKKDIFRLKEEGELPKNYPNILSVLWNQITMGEVEFKALEDKVLVQGEAKLFLLYEGEGEEIIPRFYESTIPYSGTIDCLGCEEQMILDVDYQVDHAEVEIRPDFDGEERMLTIDVALDLLVKLYKDTTIEILEDVYGVSREVVPTKEKAIIKTLIANHTGRCKVVERVKIKQSLPRMMQLCHSDGEVQLDDVVLTEEGIELSGMLKGKILYVTNEDMQPYSSIREAIPFRYLLETPMVSSSSSIKVKGAVEQLQLTMVDGDELEMKIILCFHAIVFENREIEVVSHVSLEEIDRKKMQDLPSMVVYMAQEGDTLWDVGKKYYAPVEQLREMNGITGDLKMGDKLLVVKSFAQ